MGEITSNVRAVTVQFDLDSVKLEVFFDRPPSAEDRDAMSMVETELLSEFPAEHEVSVIITTLPEPQLIPKDRTWVYFRREALLE